MTETQTEFTPGPWSSDASLPWQIWAADRERRPICVVQPDNNQDAYFPEDAANAALIARAPDLLAEVERLRALLTQAVDLIEMCDGGDMFNAMKGPTAAAIRATLEPRP